MPHFYLKHPDNTFSDFGEYPEQPPDRDQGQWVEGEPIGLALYREITLHDHLKTILLTLPDAVQAQLGPLAAAVNLALQNDAVNVAKISIENAQIPPELEQVRQAMLEKFQ